LKILKGLPELASFLLMSSSGTPAVLARAATGKGSFRANDRLMPLSEGINVKKALLGFAAAAALAAPMAASSAVIVLTFEGIADGTPVGNFYAGQGVTFSPETLALVDADAGGTGNFANEPTPNTIMFFLNGNAAILNFAAGFDTGFSFFYTSATAASVTVWDDVDGGGNLLGTINLAAQHNRNCTGDPTGSFCNWTAIGVAFAGTARSINFGGTADFTGYDNITFGSDVPRIPEPASLALLGLGLAGLGLVRRRRG
jgi:hypothetical protein